MSYRTIGKDEFLRRVPPDIDARRRILKNLRRIEREQAIDVSLSVTAYFTQQRAKYEREVLRDYYRRRATN